MAALKLDMSKAFDRVSWKFLNAILSKMGFSEHWLRLLHQCYSSVSFSVLINGSPSKRFQPQHGLRQGDPLSPYLFILYMEALSSALNHLDAFKLCKGLKLSVNGPSLSHLFFADDCLIFFQPTLSSCAKLRDTLLHFGLFSGQNINHQKSSITLSPNIPRVFRRRFQSFFHIPVNTDLASYLGLPLGVSENKRGCFQFIIDKTQQALAGWKSTLSQAGKLTLIKSVLSSLLIYLCSSYKIPLAICDKLNAISAAFWWKTGDRKPLYRLSWDKISAYKSEGGLGIRDFRLLNQALLANQC